MLSRYLARQMLGPLALALVALSVGAWATQLFRLGHHLVGGGLGAPFWASLLLYSAPSLLSFCLPFSLSAAVLYTCVRAARSNELLAMRAAGAAPLRLAGWPLLVVCACAATGWILVARAEPPALARLSRALYRAGERRLIHLPPGVFHQLTPRLTLYVGRELPSPPEELRGADVLLAIERPSAILLARRLRLVAREDGGLLLEAHGGELLMGGPEREGGDPEMLRRMTFGALRQRIDVRGALARHFAFVRDRIAADPLRRAAAAFGQGATALAIGLGATVGPLGLAIAGLLATVGIEIAGWAAQLMFPGWGRSMLLLAAGVASLLWLAARR